MKKLICLTLLLSISLLLYGGRSDTKTVKVGDKFTVYTTSHSHIQSVLWDWDSSVLELQGRLTGTSTSATFKAIKNSPTTGSVIQATTYYYKNGTTSSGVNKDVDVWKIHVKESGGGGDPENPHTQVRLSEESINIGCGEYVDLEAITYNGSYTGKFSWSSSSTDVVTFSTTGKSYARIFAESPGTAKIKVALENGNFDECRVNVPEESRINKSLQFTLSEDNNSYSVAIKVGVFPGGEIVIPSYFRNKPVTTVAKDGFSCLKGLTSVVLPSTVTTINDYAFQDCDDLAEITIPNTVSFMGDGVFNCCFSLKSIDIPDSVRVIGEVCFLLCENLTTIHLPEKLRSIKSNAFRLCQNLKNIDIPSSVTEIGSGAFACENLSTVHVYWDNPLVVDSSIFDYREVYENAILFVPRGSLEKYKTANEWKRFKNIKEGDYAGINDVSCESEDMPYEIYTIGGARVYDDTLAPGIYVKRRGAVSEKFIVY